MLTLYDLRTESTVNPLGIDHADPRFSWKLSGTGRGLLQSAYQVQVASSTGLLKNDQPDAWDSGKVLSGENYDVTYAGKPLESGQRLFWRVRVWDQAASPVLTAKAPGSRWPCSRPPAGRQIGSAFRLDPRARRCICATRSPSTNRRSGRASTPPVWATARFI